MNHPPFSTTGSRIYRLPLMHRLAITLFGFVFACSGLLAFLHLYQVADTAKLRLTVRAIGAGFALLGTFVSLQGLFAKLELSAKGVLGGLFPFRTRIPLSEITVIRVVRASIPSLRIAGGRKRISWDLHSLNDEYFKHWLFTLPNLPPGERKAIHVALLNHLNAIEP